MKTFMMMSAAALMLSTGAASAATWAQDAYGNALPMASPSQQSTSAQSTRSRMDYGTGYSGPGTATGGPVGGLPSRN